MSKKKPASMSDDESKNSAPKKSAPKKSAPKKTPHLPTYVALMTLLKSNVCSYYEKSYIIAHLKSYGYDVSKTNVSYVMTAARRHGNICVFVPKLRSYTAMPIGSEALHDIRKRRRVSNAWIQNIKALVEYATKNWTFVTGSMATKDVYDLKQEIKYYRTVSKSNNDMRDRYGLH